MHRNPLIYVVDDEQAVCDVHKWDLEFCCKGAVVKCFTNPVDAFEAVVNMAPDLLVTDYRMPGMSGLELCRKVRELGSECHVIMFTGFKDAVLVADLDDLNQLFMSHDGMPIMAFDKPVDWDIVSAYVRGLLGCTCGKEEAVG